MPTRAVTLAAAAVAPFVVAVVALRTPATRAADAPLDAGASDDAGEPDAGPLVVVARATWDPAPPRARDHERYARPLRRTLKWIVVHHSDFEDAPGPLVIKEYHLQVSGFSDIGYHFVVEPDGTVYEARAIDHMGAHAGQSREANRGVVAAKKIGDAAGVRAARGFDPDWGAVGVVLDGYYGVDEPPARQQRALMQLIEKLRADYRIAADHVVTHREVKRRIVEDRGLHFAGNETTCPGDALQAVMDRVRGSTTASALLRP